MTLASSCGLPPTFPPRRHPRDAEFRQLVGQLKLERLHAATARRPSQVITPFPLNHHVQLVAARGSERSEHSTARNGA